MGYKVSMTQEAENDLDEIVGYIAKTLLNPQAAASLLGDFHDNLDVLKTSPYGFAASSDSRLASEGYRKFIFKNNYISLYKIDESERIVSIRRIFYAKSNYISLI